MSSASASDGMVEKHPSNALIYAKTEKLSVAPHMGTLSDTGIDVNGTSTQPPTATYFWDLPSFGDLPNGHVDGSIVDGSKKRKIAVDLTSVGIPAAPQHVQQTLSKVGFAKANKNTTKDDGNRYDDTSMDAAAKKMRVEDKIAPKKQQQEKSASQGFLKEAQEIIDIFQSPKGMATITIPSGKKFTLHIGILAEKCDYFRAAFTGGFLETKTKQITLVDVSDTTFAFFLKWLYRVNLKPEHDSSCFHEHNESALTLPGLFDLWLLADYLRAPALQNIVVTNVVQEFDNFMKQQTDEGLRHISDSIKMLWEPKGRTACGRLAKPLRDLILRFVANPQYMDKSRALKLVKSVPASFLRDYVPANVERNYSIYKRTSLSADVLGQDDVYGSDPDEDEFDYMLERMREQLDDAKMYVDEIQGIWQITSEKHFIKDDKKNQGQK